MNCSNGGHNSKIFATGYCKNSFRNDFLVLAFMNNILYHTFMNENMPSYLCFLLTYPSKAFYLASCPPPSSSLPIAPNPRDKLSHDSLKDIGTKFLASVSIFSNKIGYSPQLLQSVSPVTEQQQCQCLLPPTPWTSKSQEVQRRREAETLRGVDLNGIWLAVLQAS